MSQEQPEPFSNPGSVAFRCHPALAGAGSNNAGYDYTGFALQSTTNLGTGLEHEFTRARIVSSQYVLTNPIAGPQQFFRLSQ